MATINELLSTRSYDAYSSDAKSNIKVLAFNGESPMVFGSYAINAQQYPSDIDLRQTITRSSFNNAIEDFITSLTHVVKHINSLRNHYFSEFKAGEDKRYDIDIGNMINGLWIPHKDIIGITNDYYGRGLLDEDEYKLLIQSYLHPNQDSYDIAYQIWRERRVLRWSDQEILSRYCHRNGTIFMLRDALAQKAHVKIDMIAYVDGKFIEITNFVILAYIHNGIPIPINAEMLDTPQNAHIQINIQLPRDIEKLFFSNMYFSPFKCIKRMFALARHNRDIETLKSLSSIISSSTSAIYQQKSDLDTIKNLLSRRLIDNNNKAALNQVSRMKFELSKFIYDNAYLTTIYHYIDSMNSELSITVIDKILKLLKTLVNYMSIKQLDSIGYNPIPRKLLPNVLKYRYIRREINNIIP